MEKEQLFTFIRENDLEGVKGILNKNPDLVKGQDQRGSTPLLLAGLLWLRTYSADNT